MFCISINHKNTPADVRERFAFTTKGQRQFTERLKAEVGGCVVLSTCNRMEIYFTDKYEQVEKLLAKGLKPSVYISNHMPNAPKINGEALERYNEFGY